MDRSNESKQETCNSFFLCIAIIPIIILEGISISEISDDLITQKELALDSSLVSTISNIEHYLDTRQIQAKLFASTFLPLQVDSTKIKDPSTTNRIQSQIDSMLEETTSNSLNNSGEIDQKSKIDIIFVTDLNGNILASTQKGLISKKLSTEFSEQIRKNKPYFGGFSKNGGLAQTI